MTENEELGYDPHEFDMPPEWDEERARAEFDEKRFLSPNPFEPPQSDAWMRGPILDQASGFVPTRVRLDALVRGTLRLFFGHFILFLPMGTVFLVLSVLITYVYSEMADILFDTTRGSILVGLVLPLIYVALEGALVLMIPNITQKLALNGRVSFRNLLFPTLFTPLKIAIGFLFFFMVVCASAFFLTIVLQIIVELFNTHSLGQPLLIFDDMFYPVFLFLFEVVCLYLIWRHSFFFLFILDINSRLNESMAFSDRFTKGNLIIFLGGFLAIFIQFGSPMVLIPAMLEYGETLPPSSPLFDLIFIIPFGYALVFPVPLGFAFLTTFYLLMTGRTVRRKTKRVPLPEPSQPPENQVI